MSAGRILSAAVVALGLFGSFLPASAELYPTRPVKIIVPTPAGGPVDVVARFVGNYLAAAFGQAVVVDNRPGAGNTIGSKEAAQAEPDGYTLLYSSASGLVLAPMLQKNAGYDPLTSYDPIALVAQSSNIFRSGRLGAGTRRLCQGQSRQGELLLRRHRRAAAFDWRMVQISGRDRHRARPLPRRRPFHQRPCRGPSANDLRGHERAVTADPKRQTSRARHDQLQAHPGVAGPADHGRERLFRLRLDELDRAAGASPHAARRDRQAQCPDQRGP